MALQIRVKFRELLEKKEGKGWLPGGVGGVFPYAYTTRIAPDTLQLNDATSCDIGLGTVLFSWPDGICISRANRTIESITVTFA